MFLMKEKLITAVNQIDRAGVEMTAWAFYDGSVT